MTTQTVFLRDSAIKFVDGVLTLINRNWVEVPPQMVTNVKKLTEGLLTLNDKRELVEVPPEMVDEVKKRQVLKKLNLAHNKLTSFPDWITEMTELEEIDIRGNQIKSLPDGLEKLVKLRVLQVSSNLLESFPSVVGKLPQLKELYLSANKMTSIGPEIGNMVNVEKMTLSNNLLPELPVEMGLMQNLQVVCVRNNKLTWTRGNIGYNDSGTGLSGMEILRFSQALWKSFYQQTLSFDLVEYNAYDCHLTLVVDIQNTD